MTRTLIGTAVDKGLNDIARDPKRSIRQLIDLGTFFAKGRFQRYFFDIFGELLHNNESPYYDLITNLVRHVDRKLLKTFGMNLIYNGWTQGAKTVRRIEHETGRNVPWTLLFALEAGQEACLSRWQQIIDFARGQGLYSFMLFCPPGFDPTLLRPLLQKNRSCAFLLFLSPAGVKEGLAPLLQEVKNTFVLLDMRAPGFAQKAQVLDSAQCLFGAVYPYREQDVPEIESGRPAQEANAAHAPFLFLQAHEHCPPKAQEDVCAFVLHARREPKTPVLYIDFFSDLAYIDDIISSEAGKGTLEAPDGRPRPFPQSWHIRPQTLSQWEALLGDRLLEAEES